MTKSFQGLSQRLFGWLQTSSPTTNTANQGRSASTRSADIEITSVPQQNPTSDQRFFEALTELKTMQRVMASLAIQLREIDSDIHGSVMAVTQGFQGMAQRAQSAAQFATSSLLTPASGSAIAGKGSNGQPANHVSEIQRVVSMMLQDMSASSRSTHEAATQLGRIDEHLAQITKQLAAIEQLAVRSRVVAMNGQIEAARLGKAGEAFMVVVEETKELSANATQTGTTIRDVVQKLVGELVDTSKKLKEQAVLDQERVNNSKQYATELLEGLEASHRSMTDSIQQTQSISQELGKDICKAVMGMQFEDRVSQRLSHISGSLDMLTQRIEVCAGTEIDDDVAAQVERLLSDIASHFTMESERDALLRTSAIRHSEAESTCSVELF